MLEENAVAVEPEEGAVVETEQGPTIDEQEVDIHEQTSRIVDDMSESERNKVMKDYFKSQSNGRDIGNETPDVVTKKYSTPQVEDTPAKGTPAEETPADDNAPVEESEAMPDENADPIGFWKAVAAREKKRVVDAQKKISEQGVELSGFRNPVVQVPPVQHIPPNPYQNQMPVYQPPQAPVVEEEYDFTDPKSVDKRAATAAQKAMTEMIQRGIQTTQRNRTIQQQNDFNAKVAEGTQRLVASGMAPEDVNKAVLDFQRNFATDPLSMVHKIISQESLIQEAEKRGAEAERKKLIAVSNQPKRASNAAPRNTNQKTIGTDPNAMDLGQLKTYISSLIPNSPEFNAAYKVILARAAKER